MVAAEPMTDVDTTACDMLQDLIPALDAQGVKLVFAEMKTHVREEIDQLRPVFGAHLRPLLPDHQIGG